MNDQNQIVTAWEVAGRPHPFATFRDGYVAVHPAKAVYVDCGNCPAISTGCEAGKCLRAAGRREAVYLASYKGGHWQDCSQERYEYLHDPTCSVAHDWKLRKLFTAAQPADSAAFDFDAHLQRQREFSERTFGPGARVVGITDHIRKELQEVESSGGDLREWVDVIILALDGAWRSGASSKQIIDAIVAKQTKNEGRTWPDWRTADPNKAIEHDRTGEADTHE